MTEDNKAYLYALTNETTQPDIYFDEIKPETLEDGIGISRLLISLLLEASEYDVHRLRALMCIYAGLSLRNAATVCNRSHEWVRLQIDKTEEKYNELYQFLKLGRRGTIKALIPMVNNRWKITLKKKKKKTIYIFNLSKYMREEKLSYYLQTKVRNEINTKGKYEDNERIIEKWKA